MRIQPSKPMKSLILAAAALVLAVPLMPTSASALTQARSCDGRTVTIASAAANINGTAGDDVILATGTAGQTIRSGGGNDVICASTGPDRIFAGDGNDIVLAGNGNDTVDAGNGNDTIDAGNGNDTVDAGIGRDIADGGLGIDSITSGLGADTVRGGLGNDQITGGGGSDILMGGAGNDRIDGGTQADMFVGGAGNDRLTAGTPGDTCASDAADSITGNCGTDTTGPEISDVVLPSVVNAGETIDVTWRVTDASGIDTLGVGVDGGIGPNTRATLTGDPGFVYWSGCSMSSVTRISGSSTDGVYEASCAVPAAAPNGTYAFQISAADMFGNGLAGYSQFFDFKVQNGSSDYDAPGVSYETGLVDSYRAGDDVTFTLRGTDETGISGIAVFVAREGFGTPYGNLVDDQGFGWIDASDTVLTSGTAQDGIYTVKIKLAATAIPGDYHFLLGYSDTIGNRAWGETRYSGWLGINVVP
ncbi:MAG: hypothetical protein F2520_05420 [Actinobacteria bacterium]|uniref:Unannotated protein n=1 Tax=freshwater metagenome TaxID=449393 RepID=A0A6J5YAV6_9ZZZZ|nr:hypothetical protein [Actinomycetota bacterium]MTA77681.1 hypothetical protein [Actinomycetota bacterium]